MSDHNSSETKSAGKRPTHVAYHVRESKNGEKAFWTRIGVAWMHTDGKGFNVQLEVTPLDGRISLRIDSDKKN